MQALPSRPQPPTFDEAIRAILEIAKEKGDDFRMRIFRKPSLAASAMDVVAAFDGARVEHFSTPETWLPVICGGGYYALAAMHSSDINTLVAMVVPPLLPGQPRAADVSVMRSPSWGGPATLIFPKVADPQPTPPPGSAALYQVGGAPTDRSDAARGGHPQSSGGAPSSSEDVTAARLALLDQARRYDMERLEKMIEAQAKSAERQIAAIIDLVKSQASTAARVDRPPDKPLVEQITPLLTAAVPLVSAFLAKAAEDRKEVAEREARREEREAKAREEAAKANAAIIEKLSSGNSESAKIMQSMADVVSNSLKGQMQMAATVREIMSSDAPPAEDGLIGLAKAVAPVVGDFLVAKANADAARASVAPQAPQGALPPRPPQPPPPAPAPNGAVGDAGREPTDEEAARALAGADPKALVEEIVGALKAHHAPQEIAEAYLDAVSLNTGVRDAVNEAKGTLNFFQAQLGDWITAQEIGSDGQTNAMYLRVVVSELTKAAQARGVKV
jgi:hypothetical protein